MEQILNSRERNQAFFKFLLFFLITVILLLFAVYFNFRVPVKDNTYLQNQLDIQRDWDANQAKFVTKMEEAVDLLDSLDKPAANTDQLLMLLNVTIGEMNKLSDNSKTTLYGKMDKAIWSQFDELRKAKKKLLEGKDNADRILSIQAELNNCKDEKERINRDLDNLRKSPL